MDSKSLVREVGPSTGCRVTEWIMLCSRSMKFQLFNEGAKRCLRCSCMLEHFPMTMGAKDRPDVGGDKMVVNSPKCIQRVILVWSISLLSSTRRDQLWSILSNDCNKSPQPSDSALFYQLQVGWGNIDRIKLNKEQRPESIYPYWIQAEFGTAVFHCSSKTHPMVVASSVWTATRERAAGESVDATYYRNCLLWYLLR